MITVKDICDALEQFAPLSIQESYDNCGLQIGDYATPVSSVLLSTDITEIIVEEALSKGCNMIVAHHPLIFKGLKHITNSSYVERVIIKCIKNNIAIYAAHTNYDKVFNGVSYKMAHKLNLIDTETLVPDNTDNNLQTSIGLGCIGKLPKPTKTTDFFEIVKHTFGIKAIKHSNIINEYISTVALCGGSGADFIDIAIAKSADIYLTADISYHNYFNTQNKIIIADIGHHESEKFTKEIFHEQLTDFFPNFVLRQADYDLSPILWT